MFLQKMCYLQFGKYLTRLFRHQDYRREFNNNEIKCRFSLIYTRNVKISDTGVFRYSWTVVVKTVLVRVGKKYYFLDLYNRVSFISF